MITQIQKKNQYVFTLIIIEDIFKIPNLPLLPTLTPVSNTTLSSSSIEYIKQRE